MVVRVTFYYYVLHYTKDNTRTVRVGNTSYLQFGGSLESPHYSFAQHITVHTVLYEYCDIPLHVVFTLCFKQGAEQQPSLLSLVVEQQPIGFARDNFIVE